MPRSSLYYKPSAKQGQADLRASIEIESVAGQWPRYGVRRVTHELRRGSADAPSPLPAL